MHSQRFAVPWRIVTSTLRITCLTPGASYSQRILRKTALKAEDGWELFLNPIQLKSRTSCSTGLSWKISKSSLYTIVASTVVTGHGVFIVRVRKGMARWKAVLILTTRIRQKVKAWFSHYSNRQLVLRRALLFRLTLAKLIKYWERKLPSILAGTCLLPQ